jgi:outer membrane protein OmpA-like peptidoglycan-associated protein
MPPALPKLPQITPPTASTLPKLPLENAEPKALPKLPDAPPAPPRNLPSLTALTGDKAPSTMDILQPKDAVDSKPLSLPAAPASTVTTPTLPKPSTVPPLPPAPVTTKPVVKETPKEPAKEVPADKAATSAAPPPPPVAAPALNPQAPTKLTRTVSFGRDKSDLTDDAKSDLVDVAEKIKQSQGSVRIVAYAAGTAEQASVAKRISLSRALAVRAFLISKGVNQLSINVQALGNQVPSGDADRADLFVK